VNREIVAPRYTRGVLAKYAAHVTSASFGAVMDIAGRYGAIPFLKEGLKL